MKIGPEISVGPGARALDLKISKVSVTRLSDSWPEIFGIDASGECRISDLAVLSTKEVTGLDCGALGKFPTAGQIFFTAYRFANENTLEFTKLPQESWANIGTEQNPVARNETLTVNYYRR